MYLQQIFLNLSESFLFSSLEFEIHLHVGLRKHTYLASPLNLVNPRHAQHNLSSCFIFDILSIRIRYSHNPCISLECEVVSHINEVPRTHYQYLLVCQVENLCIINLHIFVDFELVHVCIQLLRHLQILQEVYILLGSDWESEEVDKSCIFDIFILSAVHFQWECTLQCTCMIIRLNLEDSCQSGQRGSEQLVVWMILWY